jgi:hypothetical protein
MPSDPNKAAALTVKLTAEEPVVSPVSNLAISQYLATIGIKGGKARAEALSSKRRKEIAKKAAQARWNAAKK